MKLKEEKITLSRFNIPCYKHYRGQFIRQDMSKSIICKYKAEALVQIKTNPMVSRVYVEDLNFKNVFLEFFLLSNSVVGNKIKSKVSPHLICGFKNRLYCYSSIRQGGTKRNSKQPSFIWYVNSKVYSWIHKSFAPLYKLLVG